MKNILLLGVPRAGKSTFARMILKEFPMYNIISGETISSVYMSLLYEKTRTAENNTVYYDVNEPKKWLTKMLEFSKAFNPDLGFILESHDITPEAASAYNNKDNIVIFFGYPQLKADEIMSNIRKHDTPNDWTYIEPDFNVNIYAQVFEKDSKEYQKQCKKLGLKFVDTSKNREAVFKDLLEWLKQEIQ